ncbi:hypothetical protein ACT7DC_01525 [Bacillus cereus]
MALSDELAKVKQEDNLSMEMSTSEQINYRVRMSEIEYQNELIAQRIDQLAESIEKNNKFMSEQILSVSKMNRKNNENLNNKIEQLQETDQALRDSLTKTLNHYFGQMNEMVGKRFDTKTDEIVKDFSEKVYTIKEKTSEVQKMRIKTKKIEEVCVSVVQVLLYALIAVVMVTGLKWGIWNVLGVSTLYEMVAQTFEWGWLVMAIIIGVIGLGAFIFAFTFVKEKTNHHRF